MNDVAAEHVFSLPHQPEYEHTQWSPLPWLILLPSLVVMGLLTVIVDEPGVAFVAAVVTIVLCTTMFSFQRLRVVDEGDSLALRFGPVPLFRKRVRYTDIAQAERDLSSVIDGWGIHWVPGRGWTYNVWGFDCVRLTITGGRTIRIGTDDPEGLARFLQQKRAQQPSAAP